MNTLIEQGRVIDPASGRDEVADIAIADGRIAAIGAAPAGFAPEHRIDARGCWVLPGLVDLSARLPQLESDMRAAAAGGVTSLVCPPDTDPVLDEPGLVEMLITRAERLHMARVLPQGALTRALKGEALTEMVRLTEAGCVAFGQADVPLVNTLALHRAMQYAAPFGYAIWLRPQDAWLGNGVAASGALATRMGLASVPVAAETIALHTIFELMRAVRALAAQGGGGGSGAARSPQAPQDTQAAQVANAAPPPAAKPAPQTAAAPAKPAAKAEPRPQLTPEEQRKMMDDPKLNALLSALPGSKVTAINP
ncbi:MAG: hypothetical protein II058_01330 [Rhodocyclaceae bacterium]|nr:hypothetical protein [Rhodocyclaceae bacterium]